MKYPKINDFEEWTNFLLEKNIPVFKSTINQLRSVDIDHPRFSIQHLSKIVLQDPLLTLSLLKYLQDHPNKLRNTEITTIEHAIMMIGLTPFFNFLDSLSFIEDHLDSNAIAMNGVLRVSRRSYVASRLAHAWATFKKDMVYEELQVASLIHDFPELLLWVYAPGHALAVKKLMDTNPHMRSAEAQSKIFGFSLTKLQSQMSYSMHLPQILMQLLKENLDPSDYTSRMKAVTLAVRLARHCAISWDNEALPDDWIEIGKLLHHEPLVVREVLEEKINEYREKWNSMYSDQIL